MVQALKLDCWVYIPTLPFTECVTLSKLLIYALGSSFENGYINSICLKGWRVNICKLSIKYWHYQESRFFLFFGSEIRRMLTLSSVLRPHGHKIAALTLGISSKKSRNRRDYVVCFFLKNREIFPGSPKQIFLTSH